MSFLIVETASAAQARSAQAWQALGYAPGNTRFLWTWQVHPGDGRAALRLPSTPQGAQIDVPQAQYEQLLTTEERAALIEALPGADWEGDAL